MTLYVSTSTLLEGKNSVLNEIVELVNERQLVLLEKSRGTSGNQKPSSAVLEQYQSANDEVRNDTKAMDVFCGKKQLRPERKPY